MVLSKWEIEATKLLKKLQKCLLRRIFSEK